MGVREGDFATYITAIIDFHPCRRRMSKATHKAQIANVPIKMAERIVRASGGVYPEDVDILVVLAGEDSIVLFPEARSVLGTEE